MSEFAPLQKDECKELRGEVIEEGATPVVCPTCIPNPNEPKRDWLLEKDPYKDLRTCEYIAKLTAEKISQIDFTDQTLRTYSEQFRREGVSRLLRYFNRLENNDTVDLLTKNSTIPDDGIIVDDDSFIKIKIVVTAVVFDQVPMAPSQEEDPLDNNTDLPSAMEINDTSLDFYTKFTTVMIALKAYNIRYSYFRQVDEGFLRYDVDGRYELFNIDSLEKQLKEFRSQLNKFVKLNNFHFVTPTSFFLINDKIQSLEIEFDNTDPNKPLKINKVFVVSQQCPRVELKIGLDAFRRDAYMPTALYFMSNFDAAHSDVTAEQTRDWLEFITDYVYPPIRVDYGDNQNEEIVPSGLSCALDIDATEIAKNALEQFVVSALDIFEFQFNKKTCSDSLEEKEPALNQFNNKKKQERFEREYKAKLEILKKTDQSYKKLRATPEPRDGETSVQFSRRLKRREAETSAYEEQLKQEAIRAAKETINELERSNPEYFKHPYNNPFKMAIEAKVKSGDSIISFWKDLERETSTGVLSGDNLQQFLNIVGLCGFSKALKRATDCLLKQVPYEEAIKSAVRAIFSTLPIESVEEIFLGLDPQKQIEINLEIQKQFGKFTAPWENTGTIAKESTNAILQAYLENILKLSADDLIQSFEKYPAILLITDALKAPIACPSAVMKDIKNAGLKEFKIDICNPAIPVLPKIPRITLLNPWSIVSKSFSTAINGALSSIISSLVGQFIKYLEGNICNVLETAGGFFNDNTFQESLRQAFCPDASDEEINELANNLLNKIGATDDTSSAMDCLSGALLGIMSLNDMKRLLLNPEENPALLDRVIEAVSVGCPRFADLFNNRPRVSNFFNNLGNFIPSEGRNRLRDLDESDLNTPVYSSICLSSEELSRWNDLRENNLRSYGLSPEDAASQVELYNNRASEALQDALAQINQNPNQAFLDALDDLLAPKPDLPPGCELEDGTSMFGTKALQEPQEVVKIQDEVSNKMLDIIGDSFNREFNNNPNPLNPSLLAKILSDTRGNAYDLHKFLDSFLLTRAQYHNSEKQQELKEEDLGLFADFGFGEDRGYFPDTIGEDCRLQILEDREYTIEKNTQPQKITGSVIKGLSYNRIIPEKENHDLEITHKSGGIVRFGENVSYISDVLVGEPSNNFNYKISINSLQRGISIDAESLVDSSDISDLILDHAQNPSLKFKNSIFNYFVNRQLSVLSGAPTFDQSEPYRAFSELVLNEAKKLCVEGSNGFIFGFEDEDLTADELLYVGPNGEEPYNEFFTEEDQVLGRAKVESDRVTFLNPETYGGSYTIPPVYIAPKEMNGWMKISKILAPDEEQCDPKSENILRFSELKTSVNKARNSSKIDPRVGAEVEKCFVEKPFDKILSKNAVAGIEGVVRMHIRMKVVEELTRALPILGHVQFTEDNFDLSNAAFITESLVKDLKSINPLGPRLIEKNNYYILILEQAFQMYYRQFVEKLTDLDDGTKDLSSLPAEIQTAIPAILSVRDSFNYENIQIPAGEVTLPLSDVDLDSTLLNNDNFPLYALAYQKYGDAMFTAAESVTFNPVDTLFLFKEKKNIYAVIFAIRLVEKECKLILSNLIQLEYKNILSKFYEQYGPKIKDLSQHFLTSKTVFMDNKISSFGERLYDEKILAGSFQSAGQPEDIVDINVQSPWGDSSSDDLMFKIERYVRIVEKENLEVSEELSTLLNERDHNLLGVVSLENLQTLIDNNIDLFGDLNITDVFGNATISDGIQGEIGMKYGLRIVMKLPLSSLNLPESISTDDLDISLLEKTYYCNHQDLSVPTDVNISIPVCVAEVDLKDKLLKDINLLTGPESYDFDCLARKLCNSKEYRLLFNMITPIKAGASMALNYSNIFFLKTIGTADGWDEDARQVNFDSESQFRRTNGVCRRFFASMYNSNQFSSKFSLGAPRLEFPDFFKLLFGGFELPSLNPKLIIPEDQSFEHKVIKFNPFDKNGEECEDEVDKLF